MQKIVGRRVPFLLRTLVAAMTVAGLLTIPVTSSTAASGPNISWSKQQWSSSAPVGTLTTTDITFTATGVESVSKPVANIAGTVASIMRADAGKITYLGNDQYSLPVTLDVPAKSRSVYEGALQLKSGSANIGPALPVKVTTVLQATDQLERKPQGPSSDRISVLTGTQRVVKDEILVGVDMDASAPNTAAIQAARKLGAQITGSVPSIRLYQLRIPGAATSDLARLADAARGISGVEFAALNYYESSPGTDTIPNDPKWDSWNLRSPGGNNWGLESVKAPTAWDKTTGNADVRIAVIDVGFDRNHGDLNDNITRDAGNGVADHGTHVAGTTCAEGNNNHGITGMSWDCDLRLFAAKGTAAETASEMVDAVEDGARVVNMSLNYIENGNCHADTATVERLAADANNVFGRAVILAQREKKEVLWALAAGNECGRDARFTAPGGLGARFPLNTLTVAAIGPNGRLADFSNAGDSVSVAAPGVDIFSTLPRTPCWFGRFFCNDAYGNESGTSMATPHVAGLAGLVIAADPKRTAAEVKNCIVSGAKTSGATVPGQSFNTIDAPAAVNCKTLANLPAKVDVVLALDLTGSMGGVLTQAKEEVTQAITDIKAAAPGTDFRFGVVSYEDYVGTFDSRPCGSSYFNTYGEDSDQPFRIGSAMSSDPGAAQVAINELRLGSGFDGPEAYGRALWELAQADTGATLGWRSDALRLVVNFADNVPHDPNINEGVSDGRLDTGVDPGRNGQIDCGGDDIDFQDDALKSMRTAGIRLLAVDSSGSTSVEPYWRHWASLTGGAYTRLGDERSLSSVIVELLSLV
jgi:subtilisin family serine protease